MKTQIVASFMPTTIHLSTDDLTLIEEKQQYFDILELRIDAIPDVSLNKVRQMLEQLHQKGLHKAVLVTFRTTAQGGKGAILEGVYEGLMKDIAELEQVDYVDIEWAPSYHRESLVAQIQSTGTDVVVSYHNFHETPQLEVLKKTYYHMSKWKGTHLKIAVMPHTRQDVLTLLHAVTDASSALPHWITGISMSQLGIISRTAQQTFGGALTYGAITESVAPGQLDVKTLKSAMALYQ
ncbi:type I 3-dehydroquinate dehydratase [Staphylococcus ratti]|uniref:3-dehydroquinate dehydratase n=1 Tax=Staphylococcus ratti TaxID=2892440 RepID=A0ABY3PBH7_9STAP|nr:type I 3-dehydroquinate dehydratase [Staphylococcus ratti]UEX89651.1 type I 3-dehydroquinate dehydratase [Staphylococcus ratti]